MEIYTLAIILTPVLLLMLRYRQQVKFFLCIFYMFYLNTFCSLASIVFIRSDAHVSFPL
ncbi:MAG: hypothetical protein P4M11_06805 [Candidatus Pacebacteria bacterium]|nr:hypothetical protein [Candidatus Paceibacterota bacterium]